jgi:hypothetical protein
MAIYDGVLGIDEPALNEFVRTVYEAAHDTVLTGSVAVSVPILGVTRIDYDVASVPVVSLAPSALVRDLHRSMLAVLDGLGEDEVEVAADAAAQASFGLRVQKLVVTVHYGAGTPPTRIDASLNAGLQMTVEAGGVLTPDLVTLTVDIPDNPDLTEIINRGLVPELIRLIEQTFLLPIRIPPLGLGSLQVAPPMVVTGQGRLLATTALLPTQPEPAPLAGAWPADTVFVALQPNVIAAALNEAVAGRMISDQWEKQYRAFFISITLHAEFRAAVSEISVEVVPGQDGQLSGTAKVDVSADFWAKNLPSFSATGTARPAVHVTAAVNAAGEVTVDLDSIDSVVFDLDFKGLPPFLDQFLEDIVNSLAPVIINAVQGDIAKLPPQPVARIPEIPIVLDDTTVVITLKDLDVTTIDTPDGKTCLAATGAADVRVTPRRVKHTVLRDGR